MKREDVKKALGDNATDEQIQAIMNLHQADQTTHQATVTELQTRLNEANNQLNTLNETVKKFEGVDVEKLRTDLANKDKEYAEKLEALKLDNAIALAVKGFKPKNESMLLSQLDRSIIKLDKDGKLVGLNEQVENIKKDNAFLFEETRTDVDLGGEHRTGGDPKPSYDLASAVAGAIQNK